MVTRIPPFDKQCRAKLVPACTYQLTGVGCFSRLYTDVATLDLTPDGVVVTATFGTTVAGGSVPSRPSPLAG